MRECFESRGPHSRAMRARTWSLLGRGCATLLALFGLCASVVAAPGSVTYVYDELGRLKKTIHDDGTQTTYTLDAAGNRKNVADALSSGQLQLAATTFAVSEGTANLTITVNRGVGSNGPVGVSFATSPGTAVAGSDYTTTSGTLSWQSGDPAAKTFIIPIANDTVYEPAETFTVALSTPTGGATLGPATSATVTVSDNDSAPSFSIANLAVNEGAGTATLTVTKNGGSSFTHAVNYATASGSAISGSDFTAAPGTLTFAAADTTRTFTVAITNDTIFEGNEAFSANLSGATNGATIATATATVTIIENDAGPSFSINSVTQAENLNSMTFTITKTGTTTVSHTVSYATVDGTATAGQDYRVATGSHTFTPGETSWSFAVPITGDGWWEGPSEYFSVSLSDATGSASILNATGTGTMNEIAGAPMFVIQNVASVIETGGSITITVTRATLDNAVVPISVPYSMSNGTATAGSDYTATSGSVTFQPNEMTKTFSVPILNDSVTEGTETFVVSLGTPSPAATLGSPSSVTVTITEGGAIPSIPVWLSFAGCDAASIANNTCNAYFTETWAVGIEMSWISTGTVTRYEWALAQISPTSSGWQTAMSSMATQAFATMNVDTQWVYGVRACNNFGCSDWTEMYGGVSSP